MVRLSQELSIGQLSHRTGIAVSALRFYEEEGLIQANRNRGGHRRFERAQIRRVSFIMIAQKFGLSLPQIKTILAQLPNHRTPNARDWTIISQGLKADLDRHIASLERMRDSLDGCIGCGCLSLEKCHLYNPDDTISARGNGPVIALQNAAAPEPDLPQR